MERPLLDHLIWVTPDLPAGVRFITELLGVEPVPGGAHPGIGTRNALLGLGEGRYLEVVGVDPEQPPPPRPRWFGIDTLEAPRLASWAVRVGELDRAVEEARREGIELGEIRSGGRRRPDGVELHWRVSDPSAPRRGGVLPFMMNWGDSPHPSASLPPSGCSLLTLTAEHPDAPQVERELRAMGIHTPVHPGPEPALVARLGTPRGVVELR